MPNILFVSGHSYLDTTSGAALATRDLLELLSLHGWTCGAFTTTRCDQPNSQPTGRWLLEQGFDFREVTNPPEPSLFHGKVNQVIVTLLDGRLDSCYPKYGQQIIDRFQPHVILTYGGHPENEQLLREAKRRRIPVIFMIHNFHYHRSPMLDQVDGIVVPSRFAQREYARRHLISTVLPCPIRWNRVRVKERQPRYVTMINPSPTKGAMVLARIIVEMAHRRPDIPFLIVESRASINWLGQSGLNLSEVDTVHRVNNTTNIQAIYQQTKILLIPSVWWETLGRVAIEAQINGIPLIASPCGALSDVVSHGGVLLPIPIPDNQVQATIPSAEDIKPWCDTIIELWDSPERYQEVSELAQQASNRWQEEVMIAAWQSYLHHWVRS